MKDLSYKEMSYVELLGTIRKCQEEMDSRGTITTCRIEEYQKVKKTRYIKTYPNPKEVKK